MKLVLLSLSLFALISRGSPVEGRSPDRTRVKPDMHEGVVREAHLQFTHVDRFKRRRLTLDLYRPENGAGPFPGVVIYFGGGWQNGRPGIFAPLAQALAQRGYVCIVPEYRLSGEKPFPAAVHDCKAAIRWARANAKRYGIAPDRIATLGGSAGGHLAGFMGATNGIARFEGEGDHRGSSSEVQASVVMCGPMSLLLPHIVERVEKAAAKSEGDAIMAFMGGALPGRNSRIYEEASPLTHVGKHAPPMLFIDGELDRPGVRHNDFRARLAECRIPHEFIVMPGAPHPFWSMREWFGPTIDAVDKFLSTHMPPKNKVGSE